MASDTKHRSDMVVNASVQSYIMTRDQICSYHEYTSVHIEHIFYFRYINDHHHGNHLEKGVMFRTLWFYPLLLHRPRYRYKAGLSRLHTSGRT